eukprot:g1528.t1
MANANEAKYLRLLAEDGDTKDVIRVSRSPYTSRSLIESLCQKKSTDNKKEVWALEFGPKYNKFTTVPEEVGDICDPKNNGHIYSRGESKIKFLEAGLVLSTERFHVETPCGGYPRDFDVFTVKRIEEECSRVRVRGVTLAQSGDLVVGLEDNLFIPNPSETVLDFGASLGKFLVLHQVTENELSITRGSPILQEAFTNIASGIKNLQSVSVSMLDSSRNVLHVVEVSQAVQTASSSSYLARSFETNESYIESTTKADWYKLLTTDAKEATLWFLELPLSGALLALMKKFGKERVEESFLSAFDYSRENVLLNGQNDVQNNPVPADNVSVASNGGSESSEEFEFDPLNTPIPPRSLKSSSRRTQTKRTATKKNTMSTNEGSRPSVLKTSPLNRTRIDQVSLKEETRSLDGLVDFNTSTDNTEKTTWDPNSKSHRLIRKTMNEAIEYSRKVAFIVSTKLVAASLSLDLTFQNLKVSIIKEQAILEETQNYRECLTNFQAVILCLQDWENLNENDKVLTRYIVLAMDPKHDNEQRENLKRSMESNCIGPKKFEVRFQLTKLQKLCTAYFQKVVLLDYAVY